MILIMAIGIIYCIHYALQIIHHDSLDFCSEIEDVDVRRIAYITIKINSIDIL